MNDLREKLKDALRNYRYGSGATLDGSADAILALFAKERAAADAFYKVSVRERDYERLMRGKAKARAAKLVEAVRPFVVCPCCEGRDSCSESCTYRNDDPYGWGRLTALRSALAEPKEGA